MENDKAEGRRGGKEVDRASHPVWTHFIKQETEREITPVLTPKYLLTRAFNSTTNSFICRPLVPVSLTA